MKWKFIKQIKKLNKKERICTWKLKKQDSVVDFKQKLNDLVKATNVSESVEGN